MKAVQVAMLLLCINAGFFIMNATDVWTGHSLENAAAPGEFENKAPVSHGIDGIKSLSLGNTWSLGLVITGIIVGGAGALASRVTTPRVVGIVAFSGIYSYLLTQTMGILYALQIPNTLVTVISGFYFFWLVAAVIQMATGTSWRNMQ